MSFAFLICLLACKLGTKARSHCLFKLTGLMLGATHCSAVTCLSGSKRAAKDNTVDCFTVITCVWRQSYLIRLFAALSYITSMGLKRKILLFFSSGYSIMHWNSLPSWTSTMKPFAADRLVRQICGTPTKPWNTEKEEKKKARKKEKLSTHEAFIGPIETDRSSSLRQWVNRLCCCLFSYSEERGTHAISGRRK